MLPAPSAVEARGAEESGVVIFGPERGSKIQNSAHSEWTGMPGNLYKKQKNKTPRNLAGSDE
jgi:hypothetical protein